MWHLQNNKHDDQFFFLSFCVNFLLIFFSEDSYAYKYKMCTKEQYKHVNFRLFSSYKGKSKKQASNNKKKRRLFKQQTDSMRQQNVYFPKNKKQKNEKKTSTQNSRYLSNVCNCFNMKWITKYCFSPVHLKCNKGQKLTNKLKLDTCNDFCGNFQLRNYNSFCF